MRPNIPLAKMWFPWLLLAILLAPLLGQVRYLRNPDNLVGRDVYWSSDTSHYGRVIHVTDATRASQNRDVFIQLARPEPIEERKQFFRRDKSVYFKTVRVGLRTSETLSLYEIGIGRYGPTYPGESGWGRTFYAPIPGRFGLTPLLIVLTIAWIIRDAIRTRRFVNRWEGVTLNTALHDGLWHYGSHAIGGLAAGLLVFWIFAIVLRIVSNTLGGVGAETLTITAAGRTMDLKVLEAGRLGFFISVASCTLGGMILSVVDPVRWLRSRKLVEALFVLILVFITFVLPVTLFVLSPADYGP
jgi:hypothetical protein